MKFKLKIIHWLTLLWLLLIVFQHEVLFQYLSLWFGYAKLFFVDFSEAIDVLSLKLVNVILSLKLFVFLPALYIIFRKKWIFLQGNLNFSYALLSLLIWILIFAPIITDENPEFSKNLAVTKLLPPFSSVKILHLAGELESSQSEKEKFHMRLNQTVKPAFNERIIFADSVIVSESVVYFQKTQKSELQKNELLLKNGEPFIQNKYFLLGTDEYGRDSFARLIYGTRISLFVGFGAVVLSFIIGIILGFIAGYSGGIFDTVLNRFTELFLSFPVIYLIVLILALFGSSLFSVIIVLGISGWMTLFKIVRGEVVSIKQRDFFISAESIGLKKSQLLAKEILPVILAPVIVNLVFLFSNVILAEAALSYLGLGTGNLYPSWGAMINSGQEYIYKAWWMIAFPGAALILTLFAANSSGRRINKIINPRLDK
ncbi:MAG: ABC transporter permease [Ignavibacteriaceae bacterium]|nr:ABC transporter permease [Ignavibacteriaceae bacterium]